MAHIKRKSDGRLFNIISGRILTQEEAVAKDITASFLILESDDERKDKVSAMWAPLGKCDYELVDATDGFEARLSKPDYIAAAEAELEPLIGVAQDTAVAEQQERLADGDNVFDITPLQVERTYDRLEDIVAAANAKEAAEVVARQEAEANWAPYGTGPKVGGILEDGSKILYADVEE